MTARQGRPPALPHVPRIFNASARQKLLADGSIPAPSESPQAFAEFAGKGGARALERLPKAAVTLN